MATPRSPRTPIGDGVPSTPTARSRVAAGKKPEASPAVKAALERVKKAKAAAAAASSTPHTLKVPNNSSSLRGAPSPQPQRPRSRPPSATSNHEDKVKIKKATSSASLKEALAEARRTAVKGIGNSAAVAWAELEADGGSKGKVVVQGDGAEAWGLASVSSIIEKARTSGRLNLASRSMETLPDEVWVTLLPATSLFHPSMRRPNTVKGGAIDLTISATNDDRETARWYETTDLKHFNASLNELKDVPEELGGFEQLSTLDIHHNQLSALPFSVGLLVNLVFVNLSNNRFAEFPLPLLALESLQDLNLSDNSIAALWPADWRPTLKASMADIGKESKPGDGVQSPDVSLDDDFHAFFPSSPVKPRRPLGAPPTQTTKAVHPPFPSLRRLNMARNRLTAASFNDSLFALPPELVELDLTGNRLSAPLNPAAGLGRLPRLEVLKLANCALGDHIFSAAAMPLQDEALDDGNPIFPSLKQLDLTLNEMDDLANVEEFFNKHCASLGETKDLYYKGVPPTLRKVLPVLSGSLPGNACEVIVQDNYLRDEVHRRRVLLASRVQHDTLASAPARQDRDAEVLAAGIKDLGWQAQLTEVQKRKLRIEEARRKHAEEAEKAAEDGLPSSMGAGTVGPALSPNPGASEDPSVALVRMRYNPSSKAVDLSSSSLCDLAAPPSPAGIELRVGDFSRNQFVKLPALALVEWGWSQCLTKLTIARNRLDSIAWPVTGTVFSALEDLDLSSNSLSTNVAFADGSQGPLMVAIAALAPKLISLNLSMNNLTSDAGIEALLAPGLTAASSVVHKDRTSGLKSLRLGNNRIADVSELESLAAAFSQGSGGPLAYRGWRCEELDLSDNDIAKLPPALGHLPSPPLEVLSVRGNAFRVPRRQIYEGAQGTASLLKWLKER